MAYGGLGEGGNLRLGVCDTSGESRVGAGVRHFWDLWFWDGENLRLGRVTRVTSHGLVQRAFRGKEKRNLICGREKT